MRPRELAAFSFLSATWGASFLFIRIAAPAFGPFPLMAARVLIAAVVLGLAARLSGTAISFRPYAGRLLILGLVHAALPVALLAYAELNLTASMAVVAFAVQPLFTMMVSAAWQRERVRLARLGAFLLGMVGVAVLVGWGPAEINATTIRSVIAVLLSTFSYAVGAVFVRTKAPDVPPLTLALGQQLGAICWLIIPALFTLPATPVPAIAWGAMAALALSSTAVAFMVFFWLLARIGAVRAALLTYVTPITGVFWGWLFLHEPITAGILGGMGIIFVSLAWESRLSTA